MTIDTLNHDTNCYTCGSNNPLGLHLIFSVHQGQVHTVINPRPELQSHPNVWHGGLQGLYLDAVMHQTAKTKFGGALTGKMDIRYLDTVHLNAQIEIIGQILKERGRFLEIEGVLYQDGQIKTKAVALFKKIN